MYRNIDKRGNGWDNKKIACIDKETAQQSNINQFGGGM